MAGVIMPNVEGLNSVEDLKNAVGKMTKELSWLLNNLDTRNMNYIDGDVLVEGTVTANKLLVQELSAITANLGHIISGLIESVQIFGSYIATRNGAYPRAEMSSDANLFGAYSTSSSYATLQALASGSSSPQLQMWANASNLFMYASTAAAYLGATGVPLRLSAGNDIYLDVGNFGSVHLPSFSNIVDDNSHRSLSDVLNDKATRGISTSLSGSANGGIPIGTKLATADGGYVTWTGIPSHSHAQN